MGPGIFDSTRNSPHFKAEQDPAQEVPLHQYHVCVHLQYSPLLQCRTRHSLRFEVVPSSKTLQHVSGAERLDRRLIRWRQGPMRRLRGRFPDRTRRPGSRPSGAAWRSDPARMNILARLGQAPRRNGFPKSITGCQALGIGARRGGHAVV